MNEPKRKSGNLVWRSTCASCAAIFQCTYSLFVIGLAVITVFAGYVATREDIPIPNFLIRALRSDLKSMGAIVGMEQMRFLPNGTFIIESPRLYSSDFDSDFVTADLAVVDVDLPHLLIGRISIEKISLSNGRFILPAMLSASGLSETIIESIELDAEHRNGLWHVNYGNLATNHARLSASGVIKDRFFRPKRQAKQEQPNLTELVLEYAPKLKRFSEELRRVSKPTGIIEFSIDDTRHQLAELKLETGGTKLFPQLETGPARIVLSLHETEGSALRLDCDIASLPQNIVAKGLSLRTEWSELMRMENLIPERIDASITSISRDQFDLPSIVLTMRPGEQKHSGLIDIALGDSPWRVQFVHDLETERTDLSLEASLSTDLPKVLTPFTMEFANQNLTDHITVRESIDLAIEAELDEDFKPLRTVARVQSGLANLRGAQIDRATVSARVEGPQISIDSIKLRSDTQFADISIFFNTSTLFRRILLEGKVDPNMINGWFLPWWEGMWEGMKFPEDGMYTAMDSQGTVLQPETVYVTGIAHAQNMNLRGIEAKDLRVRYFSLFHYIDLYDIELNTMNDRFALGDVQFTLDRDVRDEQDKLTGLWIDAVTNLDLRRAPEIIWEVEKDAREILEPYNFDIPPHIVAKSSTFRELDEFIFDIDLQLKTENEFLYYGFPFESVEADVYVKNDHVDVTNGNGKVGEGDLKAEVHVRGDDIEIDASIANAHFGKTLIASNTYFANDGSESALETDLDELLAFGGTLDLDFSGKGITGDSMSYVGKGSAKISDGHFGKTRFFGGVSKLLENARFGIATINLDDAAAEGEYIIDHNRVTTNKFEIRGPTALAQLNGNYFMDTDDLDMRLRVFPFRYSKIPLIMDIVNLPLNVLSNAFELSMRGPISDPNVRLSSGDGPETSSDTPTPPN